MKHSILLIGIILFLFSCNEVANKNFFDKCNCETIHTNNGFRVFDSIKNYSIICPDSSWDISRNYDSLENHLMVSDTMQGFLRLFSVTELERNFAPSIPWKIHQEKIEELYNVVEKGKIRIGEKLYPWNLVKLDEYEPECYTLFVTINHPTKKLYYTLNLSVWVESDYFEELCRMEKLIKSFRIE